MKRKIFLTVVFLLTAVSAIAVNTTTIGTSGHSIEVTGLDADWVWNTDVAAATGGGAVLQKKVQAIYFYPSAASDRMIIRDGGIDNATICDSGSVPDANSPRVCKWEYSVGANFTIDITDCTLDTAASAKVVFVLER